MHFIDCLTKIGGFQSPYNRGLKSLFLMSVLSILFMPSLLWAWSYKVSDQIKPGRKGTLQLVPPETLKKVKVTLKSQDTTFEHSFKMMKAGRTYTIRFMPPKGQSNWIVDVVGYSGQDTLTAQFEFTVVSARPLKTAFLNQKSSLKKGLLYFKSNNILNNAHLTAYGDQGEVLWEDQLLFKKQGKHYVAQFTPRDPIPRRLEIKTTDEYGSWLSIRVVRWYAEVPHEDILFKSGSADIEAQEEPKMRSALKAVHDELKKFRKAMNDPNVRIDLQLYVGGYTDTIGSVRDNQRLSERRARSIATYFKKQGLPIRIRYAGFGEGGLLVKTPDQTDEPRNRRAVYIVANQIPSGPFFPKARWKTL